MRPVKAAVTCAWRAEEAVREAEEEGRGKVRQSQRVLLPAQRGCGGDDAKRDPRTGGFARADVLRRDLDPGQRYLDFIRVNP